MRRTELLASVSGLVFSYTMLLQDLLRDLFHATDPVPRPEHDRRGAAGQAKVITGPWVARVDTPRYDGRGTVLRPVGAMLYE